jgi:hypothetical protein
MHRALIVAVLALAFAGVAHADVRTDEKTQVKFEGMLGRMLNFFGGKTTRDGSVSTVAVKGDRKMTLNGDTAQIVDLNEEKVYDLNMNKKTYTFTTFAELRKRMEDARKKAVEQAPKDQGQPAPPKSGDPQQEIDVDFGMKESGQRKTINGFDTREVVMTIAVRQKGKALDDGGFVLTSRSWLAPKIQHLNEIAAFDLRFFQKLGMPTMLDAQQMATALAMYPMMKDAIAKLQSENVNLDGTPVLTVVTFEAAGANAQGDSPARQEEPKGLPGLGGIGGRLGRRIMNRGKNEAPPAAPANPNRVGVMTMQHEIVSVSPTVSATDVAIPSGFTGK